VRDAKVQIRAALQNAVEQCCARVQAAANAVIATGGKLPGSGTTPTIDGGASGTGNGGVQLPVATNCLVGCVNKQGAELKACGEQCIGGGVTLPQFDATTTACLQQCATTQDASLTCAHACTGFAVPPQLADLDQCFVANACKAKPSAAEQQACGVECVASGNPEFGDTIRCGAACNLLPQAEQQACALKCAHDLLGNQGNSLGQCAIKCGIDHTGDDAAIQACATACVTGGNTGTGTGGTGNLITCAQKCNTDNAGDAQAIQSCAAACVTGGNTGLPSGGGDLVACAQKCNTDNAGDAQAIQTCATACVTGGNNNANPIIKCGADCAAKFPDDQQAAIQCGIACANGNPPRRRRRSIEATDTSKCPVCQAATHRVFRLKFDCAKLAQLQARIESFAATQFAELIVTKQCARKRATSGEGDLVVAAEGADAGADASLFVATLDGVQSAEEIEETPEGQSIYDAEPPVDHGSNSAANVVASLVVVALGVVAVAL
jgi:hypothetical protein